LVDSSATRWRRSTIRLSAGPSGNLVMEHYDFAVKLAESLDTERVGSKLLEERSTLGFALAISPRVDPTVLGLGRPPSRADQTRHL